MIVKDTKINKFDYNGKQAIQRKHTGKEFTKPEIKVLIKDFQEKYKNKDLTIMISVNTPYGFRSSKPFGIQDDAQMVDDYEWYTTNGFMIYGWKSNASEGGDSDESNDCLFQCIKQVCNIYRLPKNLKTDLDLKKALHLKPNDKVPISCLGQVEKLYKININITGDHIFTSSNRYKQTIHLTLINEHYEIVKGNYKSKDLLKHMPFNEQKLITVIKEPTRVQCYDGNEVFYVNYEEYRKVNKFNGEYAYLDKLPFKKNDFVQDYHIFIEECEKLKELTHGKINLAKSGYKISNEALKLVHNSLLSFNEPEEMTALEQEWFHRCFKGGLIFCENNITLEYGYNYDKKSAYPSMMCDDHFSFPVKQGDFVCLNELPEILQYGIYRCKIEPSRDENTDKLFCFNNKNYYTHIDLKLARKLNLKINLIQNEQANALVYVKDRVNGSLYFRQVVHDLYKLKSSSKLAKKVLNAIWGAVCQRNKIKTTTCNQVNLNKGELIIDIQEIGNNLHKIIYLQSGRYFKHNYARLGCFLTASVRKQMADIIYPVRDKVYKCHTDSILSSVKMDEKQYLLIGDRLGDFALENEGRVNIHHSSKALEWF